MMILALFVVDLLCMMILCYICAKFGIWCYICAIFVIALFCDIILLFSDIIVLFLEHYCAKQEKKMGSGYADDLAVGTDTYLCHMVGSVPTARPSA